MKYSMHWDEQSQLYRIQAWRDIHRHGVLKGDWGGLVSGEHNLSHYYDSWITYGARVTGSGRLMQNAIVTGNSEVRGVHLAEDAFIETNNDWICVDSVGSRNGILVMYRTMNGIRVRCGCFRGTCDEFIDRVKSIHGSNRHAQCYLALVPALRDSILNQW